MLGLRLLWAGHRHRWRTSARSLDSEPCEQRCRCGRARHRVDGAWREGPHPGRRWFSHFMGTVIDPVVDADVAAGKGYWTPAVGVGGVWVE